MTFQQIFKFISVHLKNLSVRLIYSILLMMYAYNAERTPAWARRIILGAVAYLLSPIDSIPDLTPFIGFTDDLGVISFGLVAIACYIDQDVRIAARQKLMTIFEQVDERELQAVDEKL
ncbi:MAG: DUF1232 domain-containing protein [Saprospiraceae bacterium]|jgi:uncharacterized membrane protein YkvA (DUF1232 family)|nr:DUF1232 domain-containing protein [Saprospiraceae bacterium]